MDPGKTRDRKKGTKNKGMIKAGTEVENKKRRKTQGKKIDLRKKKGKNTSKRTRKEIKKSYFRHNEKRTEGGKEVR